MVEGGSARVNNARRLANEKRLNGRPVESLGKSSKRAASRRPASPEEEVEVVIKKRMNGAYFAFQADLSSSISMAS